MMSLQDFGDLQSNSDDNDRHPVPLVYELTLSAWIRTGLTAMVAGLGVARLIPSIVAPWIPRTIGAVFIVAAVGIYIGSALRYIQVAYLKQDWSSRLALFSLSVLTLALMFTSILAFILLFRE
jgi:uncharacterized membrane protein YidH (DUF202 family)